MRIHTGERPYQCQICTYAATQTSALQQHMVTHTGERNFSCLTCGQAFGLASDLKRHVRRLGGVGAFGCSVCSHRHDHRHVGVMFVRKVMRVNNPRFCHAKNGLQIVREVRAAGLFYH